MDMPGTFYGVTPGATISPIPIRAGGRCGKPVSCPVVGTDTCVYEAGHIGGCDCAHR